MELGFFARIAPFGVEQVRCEFVEDLWRAHVAGVHQIEIDAFADDAGVLRDRWADQIGGQLQHRVVVEFGGEPFLRQFDPVALRRAGNGFPVRRVRGARP